MHLAVCSVREEHAEGHRWREARKEQEDRRCERLTAVLRADRLDPIVDPVADEALANVSSQPTCKLASECEWWHFVRSSSHQRVVPTSCLECRRLPPGRKRAPV